MAFGNDSILVGNLTRDPESRVANSGTTVVNLSVAWNPPKSADGEERDASFINVVCFGELAENVATSLSKGDRVIVQGQQRTRRYESKKFIDAESGNAAMQTAHEIVADEVSPSLRWATASVSRTEKSAPVADAQVEAYEKEPF